MDVQQVEVAAIALLQTESDSEAARRRARLATHGVASLLGFLASVIATYDLMLVVRVRLH